MHASPTLLFTFICALGLSGTAQEPGPSKPVELEILQSLVGVWDADIEVWPQGPESPSIKFEGVETNRAYGEYWIASDFESEYIGQTMKIHSIVGYDPDQKKLVGTAIDQGPYAASMTGEYDEASKTIHWTTEARDMNGTPMLQHTKVTQTESGERTLILQAPNADTESPTTFMKIKFVRRE